MRTLYHVPLFPSCRKIRMMLREKEMDCALVQESVWEPREDFFHLNPACDVPVLVEEDGHVIAGEYAITEYLEAVRPEPPLLGTTTYERVEICRLVEWFDKKFNAEVTQLVVYEKLFRSLGIGGVRRGPNSDAIRAGKENILYHLDYIAHLTESRRWLGGEHLSLADLTAAAHISALDYLGDVPWNHAPGAKDWYAMMKSRPSVRMLLADRVAGRVPPPYYEDPDF
jgi:glutathione S-transferase